MIPRMSSTEWGSGTSDGLHHKARLCEIEGLVFQPEGTLRRP